MLCVSTALAVELNVSNLADLLIKTQKENQLIPVLSDQYPELDVETAYLVQRAYVKRRLSDDQIAQDLRLGSLQKKVKKSLA